MCSSDLIKTSFNAFKNINIQILVITLLFGSYNLQNITNFNNLIHSRKMILEPPNKLKDFSQEITNNIFLLLLHIPQNHYSNFWDMFQKCTVFIMNLLEDSRGVINEFANNIYKASIVSESIGGEDECLESNNIYALISINFPSNNINQDFSTHTKETQLFFETLTNEIEICIWKACNLMYDILEDAIKMVEDNLKKIFLFESISVEGVNYKENGITLYEQNHREKNNLKKYDKYLKYISNLRIISCSIIIVLVIGTITSFCFARNKEVKNNKDN